MTFQKNGALDSTREWSQSTERPAPQKKKPHKRAVPFLPTLKANPPRVIRRGGGRRHRFGIGERGSVSFSRRCVATGRRRSASRAGGGRRGHGRLASHGALKPVDGNAAPPDVAPHAGGCRATAGECRGSATQLLACCG